MRQNEGEKRPKRRPKREAAGTVRVLKRPDAKPEDKDAWRELGPNAPLIRNFLVKFHLHIDDQTWGGVHPCLLRADDTARLREVVRAGLSG